MSSPVNSPSPSLSLSTRLKRPTTDSADEAECRPSKLAATRGFVYCVARESDGCREKWGKIMGDFYRCKFCNAQKMVTYTCGKHREGHYRSEHLSQLKDRTALEKKLNSAATDSRALKLGGESREIL